MSQIHEHHAKKTFRQNLSIFIHKTRFILLGVVIALFAVIIFLLVYNSIQSDRIEEYTAKIEAIQEDYDSLATAATDDEKNSQIAELKTSLNGLIENSPKNYALQRALLIRGNLNYQTEDYTTAIADFERLAKLFPQSYLAPVALIDAAVSCELTGDNKKAISLYERVIDDYSEISPEIPNLYFSVGRLQEELSDTDAAISAYNSLIDNFPDSNWTKLARSRIIYLETE